MGIWIALFVSKFIESYFIIFSHVYEGFEAVFAMDTTTCLSQEIFNVCIALKYATVAVYLFLLLLFFYLDTYVWWLGVLINQWFIFFILIIYLTY